MNRTDTTRRWTGDEAQSPPDDLGHLRPNPELSEDLSYPLEDHLLPVGVLAPRSQVKIRRFSRLFNFANYWELVERARRPSIGYRFRQRASPDSPLDLLRAANDAVRDVRTQEQVVDWGQVRKWVRSGRMQLTDLIDVGRGWETVQACVELGEEVDLAMNRSRWGQRLRVGGLALLFAAAWGWRWVFGL